MDRKITIDHQPNLDVKTNIFYRNVHNVFYSQRSAGAKKSLTKNKARSTFLLTKKGKEMQE
jgi:hypothetical protein